ncbi:MAG TPA: isoprenylcysteine carboxylmethyltransferase family protein [Bacteroidota bacterium]|nr:isoprenylcysteine carboxylmethyltransferase family protein [Bacteroidota bacterium]
MDPHLRANYILTLVAAAGLSAVAFLIYTAEPPDALTLTGLLIMILAGILLITARIQLGSSFAVTAQARRLVTTGLYARFRHPIYLFAQAVLFGIALSLRRPAYFAAWLILLAIQISRARREDKVLEEKFGDEFREYRKKTWF